MGSDNQYLRWGLPGIIFLFVFVCYWILSESFSLNYFIGDDSLGLAFLAAIIGISIPLGCIIYQLYFTFRWWVMSADKLIKQTTENINVFNERYLNRYEHYKPKVVRKMQGKWPIIESYWYKKVGDNIDKYRLHLDRYEHLLTLYHSLGAIITSIILGHIMCALVFFVFMGYTFCDNWKMGMCIILIWTVIIISLILNRIYIRHNLTVFHNYILRVRL